MTETELINEAAVLAKATKTEMVKKHRDKFPTDWVEVCGAFDPPRHQMLADLIVDLAWRFKANSPPQ